jgi:hypothetical protein
MWKYGIWNEAVCAHPYLRALTRHSHHGRNIDPTAKMENQSSDGNGYDRCLSQQPLCPIAPALGRVDSPFSLALEKIV